MAYVPIRVSTLRGDQKIDFDAYVKINDKYVLYLRRGDSFGGNRLVRLREKKLRKMFIDPNDEGNYRSYLSKNIEMAYDKKSKVPLNSRSEIVQGSQQSSAEEVMENPGNQVAYNDAKDVASKFVDFLNSEGDALKHILNIENLDQNIAHHGVAVSTLAVALAVKLGITEPKQTQLLALGAQLHDIGHFNSSLNICRPLNSFTDPEMLQYKDHPRLGGLVAQDKKHFDQTVINIITQHEEYIDGKGFPQGLNEAKIDPLALITASANALDRLMTFEGVAKGEVIKKLMITSVGKYPLQHLQLLSDILKTL